MNFEWQSALPALSKGVVSYDSEFMHEDTYYPDLLLIQTCQADWQQVALFDVWQAKPTPEQLAAWLAHDAPFLMHAGQSDLQLLMHMSHGALPRYYLDSQIGFAFCGADFYHQSYAAMVKALLEIELDKTDKRSDWYQRPLSRSQMAYAAADAYYLMQCYPILCDKLSALGRLEWWVEDSETFKNNVNSLEDKTLHHWYHLSGAPELNGYPKAKYIAGVLVRVREQLAKDWNKKRHHILSDFEILKAARKQPRHLVGLMEELPRDSLIWEAMEALEAAFYPSALQAGTAFERQTSAHVPMHKIPSKKAQYQYLREQVDNIAADLNLHPRTLVSTGALKEWCANPDTASVRLDAGFRKALFQHIL